MPDARRDAEHDSVMQSTAKHLVVTAPPGTGKTFLSVRLAGHLAPAVPAGGKVLLLTFSTQARAQLEREADRQLSPDLRKRVEITNYHRFFWHGVLAYRRALDLPMRLDIGSRSRREAALEGVRPELLKGLRQNEGLVDSLAEQAFPEFRDHRTPSKDDLDALLTVVQAEQRAGHLVFDDLGALFWSLMTRYPAVANAYRARYRAVIADEHQDASALQDAIVRWFGRERMVVFADPMQLIHEFRGANKLRLESHFNDCDEALSLQTPHRWHDNTEVAQWLLAVRARLSGETVTRPAPSELRVRSGQTAHGFNGLKPLVKAAVSEAFERGAKTVAVLARGNREVADLRSYLSRQGQYPRQVGTEDFEEARADIEELPGLTNPDEVASRALDRVAGLVPTLSEGVQNQVRKRILPTGVNSTGAGKEARGILNAVSPIFDQGPSAYFESVAAAIDACVGEGHHLPRVEAARSIRSAANPPSAPEDLDAALERYSDIVVAQANIATRTNRGLLLMTAHQAKGKEFDAVVIADATKRFWPDDEEARRLFYVAVTRASTSWDVIATDGERSPLLVHLTG